MTVETVQKQQRRVMRALIRKHGIKQVFHEGFTDAELPDYKKLIGVLRDFKKYLPTGDSGLDQFTRYQYATDLLQIGAPGQLLIDGHIKAVVPAEDAEAYEAATPVQADGRIVFDEKANEAREDAIVKRMMKVSGTAVLVLGGAHDLCDNVPAGVKLIVVPVKGYLNLASYPSGNASGLIGNPNLNLSEATKFRRTNSMVPIGDHSVLIHIYRIVALRMHEVGNSLCVIVLYHPSPLFDEFHDGLRFLTLLGEDFFILEVALL